MRYTDDGQHVVLAMRFNADIPQHHNVVIALHVFEGRSQHLGWNAVVTGEELVIGIDHAPRRIEQTLARGGIAGPSNKRADSRFRLLTRRPYDLTCPIASQFSSGL